MATRGQVHRLTHVFSWHLLPEHFQALMRQKFSSPRKKSHKLGSGIKKIFCRMAHIGWTGIVTPPTIPLELLSLM